MRNEVYYLVFIICFIVLLVFFIYFAMNNYKFKGIWN